MFTYVCICLFYLCQFVSVFFDLFIESYLYSWPVWLWSLWPANRVTRCDTIIFRWTLGDEDCDDDNFHHNMMLTMVMMNMLMIMTIMMMMTGKLG